MPTPRCLVMLLVSAMFGLPDYAGAQPAATPVIQNVTLRLDTGVITIAGSGFEGEMAVTVDGQPAAVLPGGTDTQIELLAPPSVLQTPGTYRLTVVDRLHKVGDAFVVVSQAATIPVGGAALSGSSSGTPVAAIAAARDLAEPATGLVVQRPVSQAVSPAVIEDSCSTAIGVGALASNTTGCWNTASGWGALSFNTTGTSNTAIGTEALRLHTTGSMNTATGDRALRNARSSNNTATGADALFSNSAGFNNTATGVLALKSNLIGNYNVASGSQALASNTTGSNNTADGVESLLNNTTGSQNTAVGLWALLANSTGSLNTGVGYRAGAAATTGSSNIFVGADVAGIAADTNTIRIGLPYNSGNASGQNQTFIAGIRGTQLTGSAVQVFINEQGQLGTVTPGVQSGTGTVSLSQSQQQARMQQQLQEQQDLVVRLQRQVQDQQTTNAELRARLARVEALLQSVTGRK